MSKKLDQFIMDIKNTISEDEGKLDIISNGKRFYYKNEGYGNELKEIFDKLGINSKEFNTVRGYSNQKICSITSSARLCFLYLSNKYGDKAKFEFGVKNATKKGNPSQLDAMVEDDEKITYFECKCQEIVNGEGETLRASYESNLKKYFGIDNIKINKYEKNISAHLTDLNIDYDEDYDKTHFNVKQLFTHLSAIAESKPEKRVVLQYIFFQPNESIMSDSTRQIYYELKREISAIWNSQAIESFKEKTHDLIKLPAPVFICVDDKYCKTDPKEILEILNKKSPK